MIPMFLKTFGYINVYQNLGDMNVDVDDSLVDIDVDNFFGDIDVDNFMVILMWITVKMTTLTVFLSGFVSSPEPENTTMKNLGGVIIGLYYHWYLLFLCWCCYLFSEGEG